MPILPFAPLPDPAVERLRDRDRWHPERDTLELAAAGAAKVLGASHSAARAFAKAAQTMDRVDLWRGSGMTVTGQSALPVTTVTSVRVRTPYI